MIVETDFLNHWKTRALVNAVGESAYRCLLALWAHCQTRKAWEFQVNPLMLSGICAFEGDAEKLWDAMLKLEWIVPESDPGWYQVHDWGEINSALVGRWCGGAAKQFQMAGIAWHARGYPILAETGERLKPRGEAKAKPKGEAKAKPKGEARGSDRIEVIEEIEEESPPARPAGAPASLEEALRWAAGYSKGNAEMLVIDDGWVRDWFDERSSTGWERVSNGLQIPIVDWKADLQRWCRREAKQFSHRPGSEMQKKEGGAAGVKSWAARRAEADQAQEDELATLPRLPREDLPPEWAWQAIAQEIYGGSWEHWSDVPEDARRELAAEWAKKEGGTNS